MQTVEEKWLRHPLGVSVSNFGKVIGKKGKQVYALRNGYPIVVINGKKMRIHKMVWELFGGGTALGEKLEINHKDGNKKNNHIDNLELVKHQRNMVHAFDSGLRKTKLSDIVVSQIRASSLPQNVIASIYGINQSNVSRIKSGKRWIRS